MNAAIGSTVVISALVLSSPEYVPVLITTLQAAVEPTTTIKLILPIDVVELVKAVFYGIAALCVPLATVFIMLGAARSKRAEAFGVEAVAIAKTTSKQIDGLLADRDKAKVEEGVVKQTAAGEATAATRAEGIEAGIQQERASVKAANPAAAAVPGVASGDAPVPVADERVGSMAKATGEVASAAEKLTEAKT